MFFTKNNFIRECGDNADMAEACAVKANAIIDKKGLIAYGKLSADGKRVYNFTSERKSDDSHVGNFVVWKQLGIFDDESLAMDSEADRELSEVMQMQIEALRVENSALRGRS